MNLMHALDGLAIPLGGGEVVDDMNASDDQNLLLELNLTDRIGGQLFDLNLARCQRAGKGARQSARSGSDDVVQCRRM